MPAGVREDVPLKGDRAGRGDDPLPVGRTRWGSVVLLILAGIVAAFQVGKAAIALPILRQELGLSLSDASYVLSAFALLGAFAGLPFGLAVPRLGAQRAVVVGLLVMAAGSLLGAASAGFGLLLASRVIEGCGFLTVVIAVPPLLSQVATAGDRDLAFGAWGTYMPAGMCLMLLLGLLFVGLGWRSLWIANAAISGGCALLLWGHRGFRSEPSAVASPGRVLGQLRSVLGAPGSALLAAAFGLYTTQYFALGGFLPSVLVEQRGLTILSAGLLSAAAVGMNAFGNLSAGLLMRRGIALWVPVALGFLASAVAAVLVFGLNLPTAVMVPIVALWFGFIGLVPASLLAGAARLARSPELLPATIGLIMQASNAGQLVGPVLFAAWVDNLGWSQTAIFFVVAAIAGLCATAGLRAIATPRAQAGRALAP